MSMQAPTQNITACINTTLRVAVSPFLHKFSVNLPVQLLVCNWGGRHAAAGLISSCKKLNDKQVIGIISIINYPLENTFCYGWVEAFEKNGNIYSTYCRG